MSKKVKMTYTALAGGFLLALYYIIFCFSAQDGETSGGISMKVSQMGVDFWNNLAGKGWSEQIKLQMAQYFEHPVRKMAHFAEYALMGFLQCSILRCHIQKNKKVFLFTILWVAVSAAADEIHQLFVPGRWGSGADVLLDTCGGAFGGAFCLLFVYIFIKVRTAKRTVLS